MSETFDLNLSIDDLNTPRTLFIDFCLEKIGGISVEYLYNCMIERFDDEVNFFEVCGPRHYIEDAVSLGNMDKHSISFIFWDCMNVQWQRHLNENKYEVPSKYDSIW